MKVRQLSSWMKWADSSAGYMVPRKGMFCPEVPSIKPFTIWRNAFHCKNIVGEKIQNIRQVVLRGARIPNVLKIRGSYALDRLAPINALLPFLYAIPLNDCVRVLEAVGLDAQVDYLHALRPPGLALDLMEEFRPILADRLALTVVNYRQIRARDFEDHP